MFAGDHLRLPDLAARWELERSANGLAVTDLDVSAGEMLSLRNRGTIPSAAGQLGRIDGELNLAALARQIPHALRLREGLSLNQGSATLRIQSRTEAGRPAWDVEARVADLVAARGDSTFTLRDPATLTARLVGDRNDLSLASFSLRTPFLTATGSGDLDRGIEATGTVDLGGLERQLRDVIDFRSLHLAGQGPLRVTYRRDGKGFEAAVKLDLKGLDVQGLGPLAVRRDAAIVESVLRGAMAESGLPESLKSARLKFTSGGAVADFSADVKESATDLAFSAHFPFAGSEGREGSADARISGRLDDRRLELAEVRLVVANDDDKVAPTIQFVAQGRYDRSADSLVLMPLGKVSGALGLGPEGLTASGLANGRWNAELALVGDLSAAMRAWEALDGRWRPMSDLTGTWSARLAAKAWRATCGSAVGSKRETSRSLRGPSRSRFRASIVSRRTASTSRSSSSARTMRPSKPPAAWMTSATISASTSEARSRPIGRCSTPFWPGGSSRGPTCRASLDRSGSTARWPATPPTRWISRRVST